MPGIQLIEDITNSFLSGDTSEVVNKLKKEASDLKRKKRHTVSRRLDNLIKKIPGTNGFSGARVGTTSDQSNFKVGISLKNPGLVSEFKSEILPEHVVLNGDTKNIISSLFREWEDSERLANYGLQPINKILLYGPPGTGKTRLAYAIANKLDFPLVLVRLDELVSSYLGKTGQNIREIFDLAKDRNIVLFLDEIDTVAKQRADEKELGELKRIVTVLLQNIDLFSNNSIIIGATNHDEILDKAIWRRFPLKIKMDLPNVKSREMLFTYYLGGMEKKIDMDFLVEVTNGLNGSEIEDVCMQAKKIFVISGRSYLSTIDLMVAFFRLMLGNQLYKKISKQDLYLMCQRLKDNGFTLKEIEDISQVPYTTLRDNIV